MSDGLSGTEVADELGLQISEVTWQLVRARQALGVESTRDAVSAARDGGLLR